MRRLGFTMIELVFVIVIMGILGKFGVEFIAQAYKNFIYANVNHKLQSDSEMAVESIASRLQFRIKDSVIGRRSDDFTKFEAPASINAPLVPEDYNILEWVGSDVDGLRGDSTKPYWSGIIDLRDSNTTKYALKSPETNTTKIDNLIKILSPTGKDINGSALYFVGSNSNIKTGYGWDGNALTDQNGTMHPIDRNSSNEVMFVPKNTDFGGVDVYEYYQLAWTAYAVGIDDYNNTKHEGTLKIWYDYRPWIGERYDQNGTSSVLMEHVSTFRFKAVGSVMKVQVCVKSDIIDGSSDGGYSLCKEKTVF